MKFPFKMANNMARKANKNKIPAVALTSRSFRTVISYPSTSSPNMVTILVLK